MAHQDRKPDGDRTERHATSLVRPDPLAPSGESNNVRAAMQSGSEAVTEDGAGVAAPGDATRTASPRGAEETIDPPSERLPAPLQPRDPGRYQIIAEHGRGGLGRVFRARDKELGRDIAIKELLTRTRPSELRFFREALITARLEHPGIVPVHEAGRWEDGTPFYAMKLVAGRPFDEVIHAARTVDERLALVPHVIGVANAISYAHDHKIIHRDLKPANVMVGDFGETVVIDWGLAKDLRETAPDLASEPCAAPTPSALTAAGSVMGTPAYMAPEQLRGFADERSDIYALGRILLHVLTGAPPGTSTATNYPRDIRAIAERATADDPADRYADARAFADDLRLFIQHRPIAARRYSVAARASLGFVRHRTAALAIIAALATVVAVLVGALIRLDGQRSRELAARNDAVTAREIAEDSQNDLELKHAELLLTVDPTASKDFLSRYGGRDTVTSARLLAKAHSLGVATRVAYPHSDEVWFLEYLPDGGVVSIGGDGLIRKSHADRHVTIASDAALIPASGYSAKAQRLAYARTPTGVSVVELASHASYVVDIKMTPVAMAMSPDGARLAASSSTDLWIWDLSARPPRPFRHDPHPGIRAISFIDDDVIAFRTTDALTRLPLQGSPTTIRINPGRWLAGSARWIAVESEDGLLQVLHSKDLTPRFSARACASTVNSLRFSPDSTLVAVACQAGSMAVWNTDGGSEVARIDLKTPVASVAVSANNRYLSGGGESGQLHVHNLSSGVTTRYLGHPAAISSVAAPYAGPALFASTDVNGTLRMWPEPSDRERVLVAANTLVSHAVFSPDAEYVLADANDGRVRSIRISDGSVRAVQASSGPIYAIRLSPDGSSLASWGGAEPIRVWRTSDLSLLREMREHAGFVQNVVYLDNHTLASAAADGRVLRWPDSGNDVTQVFRAATPLASIVPARDNSLVVADVEGGLTVIPGVGLPRVLAYPNGDSVTALRTDADGQYVAMGTSGGIVSLVDLNTDATRVMLRANGPIQYVAFIPNTLYLAVSSEDGWIHLRSLLGQTVDWSEFAARGRYIAAAPDGRWIAITCADGGIWVYELPTKNWSFFSHQGASVSSANFSRDSGLLVTSDTAGVIKLYKL